MNKRREMNADDRVTDTIAEATDLELVYLATFIRKVRVVDAGDAGPFLKRLLDAIDQLQESKNAAEA